VTLTAVLVGFVLAQIAPTLFQGMGYFLNVLMVHDTVSHLIRLSDNTVILISVPMMLCRH
jgi:hypothetical protein